MFPSRERPRGKIQGTFKDGKKNGPWVKYHDNGQLESKVTYKDGVNVTEKKRDRPYVRYHDNGKLYSKGTFKDDKRHGPWFTYHDNGKLESKGTYKDGKRDGPWVGYNNDGTVWMYFTGTFKNDVKVK